MPRTAKSTPSGKSTSRAGDSKSTTRKRATATTAKSSSSSTGTRRRSPAKTPESSPKKNSPKRAAQKETGISAKEADAPTLTEDLKTTGKTTGKRQPAAKKKNNTTKKKTTEPKQSMNSHHKASVQNESISHADETPLEDVLPEDAITIDRRKGKERRKKSEATAETTKAEKPKLERRAKVNRRRQIDPTTCERDYTDEEIEFMNAIDEYKRTSGRMFPTCSEVLEVLRNLGYQKVKAPEADPTEEVCVSDSATEETPSESLEPSAESKSDLASVPSPAAATWDQNETVGATNLAVSSS